MKEGDKIEITKGRRLGTTSKFAKKGDKGTYVGPAGHNYSLIKLDKAKQAFPIPNYHFWKLPKQK